MDRRASFPVFAASCPSAGLARISRSDRAANHAGLRTPRFLSFPTQHLHGGRSLLLIIVRGMEIFRMDTKSEKLALFRYGLIASLVIERLPRGELTRRAQEIAARTYDIPHSKRTAVSKRWLPSLARTADSPAPSTRNWPASSNASSPR